MLLCISMRRKQNKASMVSRALDVCYETSVAVDVPASKRLDESSKESETTVVSNEREQEKEAGLGLRAWWWDGCLFQIQQKPLRALGGGLGRQGKEGFWTILSHISEAIS